MQLTKQTLENTLLKQHLLKHFRHNKIAIVNAINKQNIEPVQIALFLGALHGLYWQALGLGHLKLAKGVRRAIEKSYDYHSIRLIGL